MRLAISRQVFASCDSLVNLLLSMNVAQYRYRTTACRRFSVRVTILRRAAEV